MCHFGTVYLRMILSKDDWRIHLTCLLFKDRTGFLICLTDDDRNTSFDNTCLLGSNLSECVTKHLSVVKTDICDDR